MPPDAPTTAPAGRIAVLIPVYNERGRLRETLAPKLRQDDHGVHSLQHAPQRAPASLPPLASQHAVRRQDPGFPGG